jgi:hypothetical protein
VNNRTFSSREPKSDFERAVGEGPQPTRKTSEKTIVSRCGGAKSGADGAMDTPLYDVDASLARIVDCWPLLTPHVKATILGMVRNPVA